MIGHEILNDNIKLRYDKESRNDSALSCGKNISYLDLKYGERVLDLGCGKGFETIEAARLVGDLGEAVGLDITPNMLEVARMNAEAQNVTNIRFMAGNIENLPFEDASCDAVMSNCVINHAEDKQKVYSEIYRVLKYGGRFVVSDAVTKYPLSQSIKDDPKQWAACFGGAITEEEYMTSIRNGGFSELEILKRREYMKNGYKFISLTIWAYKKIGQGGDT